MTNYGAGALNYPDRVLFGGAIVARGLGKNEFLRVSRRGIILGGLATLAPATRLFAAGDDSIDLNWKQLKPSVARRYNAPAQTLSHSAVPSRTFTDPRAFMVVKDYNGKRVRLPGFLIPLEMAAQGSKEFLLVPFVGACIHVPPPPPNQIVHVISQEPYMVQDLFEPVYAVGVLDTILTESVYAQASYTLAVEEFEKVSL